MGQFKRSESRSESCFRSLFWPFPDLKAWFNPLWTQNSFKLGFWNAKKKAFWDCDPPKKPDSEDLWTQSSFRTWFVRAHLEMRAEAMHGSISTVGTKYYLAARRSVHDRDGGRNLVNAHERNQGVDRDQKRRSKHDSLLCEQAHSLTNLSHVWSAGPLPKI